MALKKIVWLQIYFFNGVQHYRMHFENRHKQIVFMFSGQGTQYYHMGKDLYEHQPVFMQWMNSLDSYVQYLIGTSVLNQIYDNGKIKGYPYEQPMLSSLAIFMVEYSLAQVLIDKKIYPDFLLGSSMGEFASSVISGVMGYEVALNILVQKSKIMGKYPLNGGMIAVFDNPNLYNDIPVMNRNSDLAAINFNKHFIIAGKDKNLDQIISFLDSDNIFYQKLDIAGAYHSSLLDIAESDYKSFLETLSFNHPTLPYISCSSGGRVYKFHKYHLWNVIRKPIFFEKTIKGMEKDMGNLVYLDLGPSGTLSTFIKYILQKDSQSENYIILSPFGKDLKNLGKVESLLS